jgi:hypothetical protein
LKPEVPFSISVRSIPHVIDRANSLASSREALGVVVQNGIFQQFGNM